MIWCSMSRGLLHVLQMLACKEVIDKQYDRTMLNILVTGAVWRIDGFSWYIVQYAKYYTAKEETIWKPEDIYSPSLARYTRTERWELS